MYLFIKIIGDNTPLWGAPEDSFIDLDISSPIFTLWVLSVRKDPNHLTEFHQSRKFPVFCREALHQDSQMQH